ncbi:MAG: SDR family NAD(P)-dependent oxidoreductase [Actinobacteria bacterium]|nr:SDR family NAD(P)-dependent oxidoreductase [Actinomycetota bacterium]
MRTAVVTGASGGVGSALVERLEHDGWRVFAAARRRPERDDQLELDLAHPKSIGAARATVASALGGSTLSALVNLAGISVNGPLELVPADALRRQLEINVIGQLAVIQSFLPLLRGDGRIVNMGGAAGRLPLPMYGALSASKAALDAMSAALRMELKHQGVTVSYIEPGALRTRFFGNAIVPPSQASPDVATAMRPQWRRLRKGSPTRPLRPSTRPSRQS